MKSSVYLSDTAVINKHQMLSSLPQNDMFDDQLLYKIGITQIPKVGTIIAKNLVSYCGSAEAVFHSSKKALTKIPGVGPHIANAILSEKALLLAETEITFLDKHEIQALFYLDSAYPDRLKVYYDAPVMLYHKGNTPLQAQKVISIVGTRKPTMYGKQICNDLVEGLADFNPLIVSGLAFGIDICAHRKALELNLATVGVLGHGLANIYPHEHKRTAFEMIEKGGLLTEFTSQQGPEREHFPMRNRIIAGLCDAIVVVQTADKGGSMISAEIANNYNKDVFAFPGRPKDKYSKGCNYLIKNNKAALIENADDLIKYLSWDDVKKNKGIQKQLFVDLNDNEQLIIELLQQMEEINIDQIIRQTGLGSSTLASLLLNLEFKGLIQSLPGKRYVLT